MGRFSKYIELVKDRVKLFEIVALIIILIAAAIFLFFKDSEKTVSVNELTTETAEAGTEKEETASAQTVFVDISGEVETPGVYEMKADDRVFRVIEKAGGLTGKADVSGINRAEGVKDGQKIVIPKKGDGSAGETAGAAAPGSSAEEAGGLININTADAAKLCEIPGVGEVTAGKIIAYREENGAFQSKEDIKNVSGIGDKTYSNMADIITV